MKFLSALMPQEGRFFDLFNRHGALVAEGGRLVQELVAEFDDEATRPGAAR